MKPPQQIIFVSFIDRVFLFKNCVCDSKMKRRIIAPFSLKNSFFKIVILLLDTLLRSLL